ETNQARQREDKHETTKEAYFDSLLIDGWPRPKDIESYFLFAPDQPWPFADNDSAGFDIDGIDDTRHLPIRDQGRSSVSLHLSAHPILGVYLGWRKWDGLRREPRSYVSKGDLSRLGQFVWDQHGSLYPVAFFVSYATAWRAVKEFLETDGALPESIEWI